MSGSWPGKREQREECSQARMQCGPELGPERFEKRPEESARVRELGLWDTEV